MSEATSQPEASEVNPGGLPALVLEADVNGVGVIRSLAARGVRVWAADADPLAPGLRSRYVERRLVCPSPRSAPRDFIAFLRNEIGVPVVLVPTTDPSVQVLAHHASKLAPWARLRVPPVDVIDGIVDKRVQYAVAGRHGIPMPATWIIDDDHPCEDAAARVPYPCLLKPAVSTAFFERFNRKAIRVSTPSDLCAWYRHFRREGHDMLVQELIPGDVTNLVEVTTYIRPDGTLEGAFAARKLEHFPEDFGSGTVFQSLALGELLPLAQRVLETFRFTGLSHVELKRDPRDGRFKFIELNPRTSISSLHPTACGINFSWLAYRDAAGEPPAPPRFTYDVGRCWVLPELRLLLQRRLLLPREVRPRFPFHPRHSQAILSLRDPLPELFFLLRAGLRFWRRALAVRRSEARVEAPWRERIAR
jgi:predicted ATP-grasp superfamily ATP-dependent carboligase